MDGTLRRLEPLVVQKLSNRRAASTNYLDLIDQQNAIALHGICYKHRHIEASPRTGLAVATKFPPATIQLFRALTCRDREMEQTNWKNPLGTCSGLRG